MQDEEDVPAGAYQVLAVVFLATVVISLSSTMLTIALPSIAADLDATASGTGWALTAYLLTNTASTMLMGQVADSVDRRRMFLAGLTVFTVTSAALSLADSVPVLVALRATQGIGAAMLLCNAVAVLVAIFPGRLLGRAMGVYLAGFSIAQVAGPAAGGIVTATIGWRYLFLLSVPVCLLALVWAHRALRRLPEVPRGRLRVDVPGNVTAALLLVLLLGAVTVAPDRGWSDPWVLGSLALGIALLPVLVAVQLRAAYPVLDPALFRDPPFARGMLAGFLVSSPRLGIVVASGLYFQGLRGASALEAAGHVTVAAGGLTVGALVADGLARRYGARPVSAISAALSVVGLLVLVWAVGAGADGSRDDAFTIGLLVVGLGTGVFHPINVSSIMRGVPAERAGTVNAVRVTLQSTSLALASAAAVASAVAFVGPAAAASFVSGDPAGLSAADVEGIVLGHQLLFAAFAVLVVAGGLVTVSGRGRAADAEEPGEVDEVALAAAAADAAAVGAQPR
ncbi:MFS transporter [Nocardioides marmotae]|uniref:MFS transporter n=1 Tax=Nocardioides marmotae TaxID=2663857 RepID=UPI0012B5DA6D|nr:MFS transporter [Nocardioides marmotae]MBC9735195.1 MFS transporter [Nocardioides marmotae]MTB86295.1 MFS transporter [Nocardioides marmotae]